MLGVSDNPRVQPKSSLVDDAYRALKEAIRENAFPPGYQGSEMEIAQKLGMSRTPVHEAVIRLQERNRPRDPDQPEAAESKWFRIADGWRHARKPVKS